MNRDRTNEAAFPRHADATDTGMTLRDYFAAKAMQAYLTREDSASLCTRHFSKEAYKMADAMMDIREMNYEDLEDGAETNKEAT